MDGNRVEGGEGRKNKRTKRVVGISNKLLCAGYSLSLTEKRLLWSLIGRIKPDFIDKSTNGNGEIVTTLIEGDKLDSREFHSISISEFAKEWEIAPEDARKELISATSTLYERSIEIYQNDGSWAKFRWIQDIEYNVSEDTIKLRWSESIIEHISQLSKAFTNLRLKDCVDFRSIYTWKLYDYLKSLQWGINHGHSIKMLRVSEFMDIMSVADSGREYKVFKSKVIKPAIAELLKHSIYKGLEIVEEKRGRSIVKVGIKIIFE